MRPKRVALKHHVDGALVRRQPHDVLPGQQDLPGGGALKAGQHTQQGGLAAAGGTQQGEDLALLDIQCDLIYRKHIVEVFDDAVDLQEWLPAGLCRAGVVVRSGRHRCFLCSFSKSEGSGYRPVLNAVCARLSSLRMSLVSALGGIMVAISAALG